jgi:hypothetical protein
LLIFAIWHEHYMHGRPSPSVHPAHFTHVGQEPRFVTANGYANKLSVI